MSHHISASTLYASYGKPDFDFFLGKSHVGTELIDIDGEKRFRFPGYLWSVAPTEQGIISGVRGQSVTKQQGYDGRDVDIPIDFTSIVGNYAKPKVSPSPQKREKQDGCCLSHCIKMVS